MSSNSGQVGEVTATVVPPTHALAGLGRPDLTAKRVALRPPLPTDLEWLYLEVCKPAVGLTWRLMGAIPSFEQFAGVIWAATECQFVLTSNDASSKRLGLAQMIRYDPRTSTAHLSFFVAEEYQASGWPIEGILLFIDYVFRVYPLRKLYLESLRPAFDQYASAVGRHLEVEGVLADHDVFDGQFVDLIIASTNPERWARSRATFRL